MKTLAGLALGLVLGCGGGHSHWFGRISEGGDITPNIDPPKDQLALAARELTRAEQHVLDDHGFAILGSAVPQSFHVGYSALFHAHQPVYLTADALLYAWHASYDKILIDVERAGLIPAVNAMLGELRGHLAAVEAPPQVRADLDVYLAIAQSLATGKLAAPVAGGDPALIAATVDHGVKSEGLGLELFGDSMQFDFSMLKPRGHYTDDAELQQYFRAMSWLGRAEIRIANKRDANAPWVVNRRALHASLLLASLVSDETRAKWQMIDTTLGAFIGPPDSMSLPGLGAGLAALHGNVDELSDDQIVTAFGAPARQQIRTQLEHADQQSLAFLLLGQRFVADAGVLGDLVYGSLATNPERMMPTPLDVAHVVFHNPIAHALLAPELAKYGAPYEAALASHYARPLPTDSIYHLWLGALRELSPNATRDAALPKPLTSEAWGRRLLLAQLASWAELRHDNLLYAKQSFTAEAGCEYPDAYIDPYPSFYAAMEAIAQKARSAIAAGAFHSKHEPHMLEYFDRMESTMAHLHAIADRERTNQPISDDDLAFMNRMVSLDGRNIVCSTTTDPKGWYAELFYEQSTAMWHTPVIADVHTQPTNEHGDMVGRVLHVGTGKPRMIAIKIEHDGGAHTQTYRGFVSSYAEVTTEGFHRMTDEAWREQTATKTIGTPPWMTSIIAR